MPTNGDEKFVFAPWANVKIVDPELERLLEEERRIEEEAKAEKAARVEDGRAVIAGARLIQREFPPGGAPPTLKKLSPADELEREGWQTPSEIFGAVDAALDAAADSWAEPTDHAGENGYVVKDSGAREEFDSGARRDTQDGKPRFDLIPPIGLTRLADLYTAGLKKYGENNWTKGMPVSRYLASAERHLQLAREGKTDEDHWAAVCWNVMAIMHFEHTGWNDLFDWTPTEPSESGDE